MSGLRSLLALGNPPRARLGVTVLLGALTILCGVGLMATAGYLISRAAERPTVLSLMVAIVAVRFFGLGRPIVRYLERLSAHDVALRVLGRVRVMFYDRIEPLAPAQLECYRKGDLLSRMVADVDALQNLYLRGLGPPLVALAAGAVSVGIAAAFLPAAGLVLAAGLLAGGLAVPALSGSLRSRSGRRQASARGELSAELVELLRGAPELAAYGAEQARLERVRTADYRLVKLARTHALATGVGDGLGLAITGLTVAGVLAVTAAASAPRWPFTVALEGVRARYPRQPRPALDGVSLALQPGERVALVGASGAGKTTVANLLLRYLDPEEGRVTIAGTDLRDYRQEDIRRAISVAGQESHLFSASIGDNVHLSRPDATGSDLERSLRRARIWDWIEGLPQGLDTFVGEEGDELSGGQRQRIILARALLADAPVLVLDEPTAHLDPPTAVALMRDVFSAVNDRTVLLITHRSEGLELVDRVLMLQAGSGRTLVGTSPEGDNDDCSLAWRWTPDVMATSLGTHAAYVGAVAIVNDNARRLGS